MSEKEKAPKTRAEFLRDAYEGMKGHQPVSDDELNQWLATDEGKVATLLTTQVFRLGASEGDRSNACCLTIRPTLYAKRTSVSITGSGPN